MAKAIALTSIGCRTNREEMDALAFRLVEQGLRVVERIDEADLVIVNTCSVTAVTEAKTRRFLRQVSRSAPEAGICVTGCLAQQKAHELKRQPNVRWVVGNALKDDIPRIIAHEKYGVFWQPLTSNRPSSLKIPAAPIFYNVARRTRFSIKVQEGCDFRCAYCIVPLLRGGCRSAPLAEVHTACLKAIDAGFKEIVLTGTHIGQYRDAEGEGLTSLIESIIAIPGDYRVRLSSLDPRDLSAGLVDLVATDPRLCRHLHVSVQSLSQKVIESMGRGAADSASITETLRDARRKFPELGIGGDFIVGFPGETDASFEETLDRVEKIGFSYGHVFRYSKRPMTAAAEFPGQIDEKEKRRRAERLRAVLDGCRLAFIESCASSVQRIVVEVEEPLCGLSSNYLHIVATGAKVPRNSWCTVMITGIDPGSDKCRAVVVK